RLLHRRSHSSIDERHSPLRFIAAERLRGRVKRRARGGLGRVGAFCFDVSCCSPFDDSTPPAPQGVIGPPLTIIGEASSFGCSNAGGARRLSTPHTNWAPCGEAGATPLESRL